MFLFFISFYSIGFCRILPGAPHKWAREATTARARHLATPSLGRGSPTRSYNADVEPACERPCGGTPKECSNIGYGVGAKPDGGVMGSEPSHAGDACSRRHGGVLQELPLSYHSIRPEVGTPCDAERASTFKPITANKTQAPCLDEVRACQTRNEKN